MYHIWGLLIAAGALKECPVHAGPAQQSMQRKGRVERRHQQQRAKQRLRPEAASGEAVRARSSSSASTAFIPEGKVLLNGIFI